METKELSKTITSKDSIKFRLANAMKECLATTSLENITVKQLTETCGVSRQTFYRNFLDKYDLINWYFDTLLANSFDEMGSTETVYEGLIKKFNYINNEKLFFSAAFKSDSQNNLKEHDYEMIFNFYTNLLFRKTGTLLSMIDESILDMYCHSSIYMTVKWVTEDLPYSPELLAKLLISALPVRLEKLFKQNGLLEK